MGTTWTSTPAFFSFGQWKQNYGARVAEGLWEMGADFPGVLTSYRSAELAGSCCSTLACPLLGGPLAQTGSQGPAWVAGKAAGPHFASHYPLGPELRQEEDDHLYFIHRTAQSSLDLDTFLSYFLDIILLICL